MPQEIIKKVVIKKLFGRYDFVIPGDGYMTNPSILYGDNGVGKSTILSLIFHLLSPAGDRGHRSSIRKIQFCYFEIELSNGFRIVAERPEGASGEIIDLRISKNDELNAVWNYKDARRREADIMEIGEAYRFDFKNSGSDTSELGHVDKLRTHNLAAMM